MTNKPLMRSYTLVFIMLLTCFTRLTLADTEQNSDNILNLVQQLAENYVEEQVMLPDYGELNIQATQLDSRLRLSECQVPLEPSIPGRQNLTHSVNVLIRCPQPTWQIYVPVRIHVKMPLVVATRPLGRGEVIQASDVQVSMTESRFQRGMTYNETELVVGAKVRRGLNPGEIIKGNDICLVCRNDTVRIIAAGGGLNIITPGKALSDGLLGEQIKVQNNKSRRVIDGRITGVGEVSVDF
ncbi:flagellar basal body P-ring formation chaperone FlgA [Thaumasiovibrio subtropicus]|uniref:flagellar basal body P-ring formation chaperone FlgA n=1 Tax=Thaumasiovibrio subtropicus TaxID=1891207 RepID=UPI001863DC8A|nr:flagellar basal body P-ring formation chaperone FlgA [Thaumasiovibrio subtropicus]